MTPVECYALLARAAGDIERQMADCDPADWQELNRRWGKLCVEMNKQLRRRDRGAA